MWTRAELKDQAKAVLNRNYGKMIVISLISLFIGGGIRFNVSFNYNYRTPNGFDFQEYFRNFFREFTNGSYDKDVLSIMVRIVMLMAAASFLVSLVQLAIVIFLSNPLRVSMNRFMLFARVRDDASLNELGYGFKYSYGNIVKIMFLKWLYEFLWGLLFIIPGIIKSYEYLMIPYLLAENPDLSANEAFAQSKQMMDGEKMNAFVLGLSFFGWIILSMCTCYLLLILYVMPYMLLTFTELYVVLKQKLYGPYQGYSNYGYDQGYNQSYNNPGNNSNYNQNYNQGYNQNNNQNYGQDSNQVGSQDNGPKQ